MRRVSSKALASVEAWVCQLYGAYCEETDLAPCLSQVGELFGSHLTGLTFSSHAEGKAQCTVSAGAHDKDWMSRAWQGYEAQAPRNSLWVKRSLEGYRRKGYEYGEAIVSDRELLASDYYKSQLRPFDVRHGMGICLEIGEAGHLVVVSLNRTVTAGPFGPAQFTYATALRPHLVNILRLHRRFDQAEFRGRPFRAGFERSPIAMFVIDADGLVIEANDRGHGLVGPHGPLTFSPMGALSLPLHASQQELRERTKRVCGSSTAVAESMVVRRALGNAASTLVLHLCPIPAGGMSTIPRAARALVFALPMCELDGRKYSAVVVRKVLGLTEAEANLCVKLHAGRSLEEASRDLGIALSTARTHLKHTFQKTGASRQAELTALIGRLVTGIPH